MVCCGDKERKMKKIFVVFALFCAMVFVASCGGNSSSKTSDSETSDSSDHGSDGSSSKTSDSETSDSSDHGSDGSSSESGDAGIHLGIIGFNYQTTEMEIRLLTDSNKSSFINFIGNLYQDNNTALYFADDTALDMMASYDKPPKLQHVALVTFTDGIDNQSIRLKPEYNAPDDYLNDVHKKIVSNKIHGLSVEAYSIGLETREEIPEELRPQFQKILEEGLASSKDKAFIVSDMDEVSEIFADIADNLIKVSTSINYGVYMPGGYPDGQVIRYIFDNKSANDSSLYIEATYKKQNAKLESITYHGFAKGAASIQATDGPKGSLYYQFDDLRYSNGTTVSQNMSFVLWKQVSGSWMTESEITAADYPPVVKKDMSSALIMMVLDCTTSLSSENFKEMKKIAEDFVRTLAGESSGGNTENNGENGGEDNNDSSDDSDSDIDTTPDEDDESDIDSGDNLNTGDTSGNQAQAGKVGAACTIDDNCTETYQNTFDPEDTYKQVAVCQTNGFPNGYCTFMCDPTDQKACDSVGETCYIYNNIFGGDGFCFHKCTKPSDCRAGYRCSNTIKACLPDCAENGCEHGTCDATDKVCL